MLRAYHQNVEDVVQSEAAASVLDRPDTVARLFLGFAIPAQVQERLTSTAQAHYGQYIERMAEPGQAHLTLFFFGDVRNHAQYLGRLKEPLPQTFVPTVSITHIGRGAARDQLWAHVAATPALLALREAIAGRLRKIHFPRPAEFRTFRPHIRLAQFYPVVRGLGIADVPAVVSFTVKEAYVYQSNQTKDGPKYTILATIPF